MDLNKEVLSKIVVFNKYAKYITEKNRRETFNEIVDRCKDMHKEHFKDKGEKFLADIDYMFDNFVKTKKVLPSMRSCQFAGKAVELNPARQYNCSYLSIDNMAAFPEAMFLLLSGTGVGFSVQKHHVEKLPPIKKPMKFRRFVIEDSIAGWADAVKVLCKAYLMGKSAPLFDYRDIREKGMPLITSGGKAPGAEPLRNCLHKIKMIFERKKDGEQLSTLECHDIMCHIADAVLSGGIRRAACISLFSMDDEEMLSCKAGNWWETNPQRGRANNSALVLRHRVKKDDFLKLWERIKASGSGEPGIYFSNNQDWGINPCCEIALRSNQMCNLTTINASDIKDQDDLEARCAAASFIGTLQAAYTDFYYLRDTWKKTCEKEALLGVSMTGIASNEYVKCDLKKAAEVVKKVNGEVAGIIGINPAARATCVKPEGTASLVLGTSSGIHSWYAPFYVRRMKVGKNEEIYQYLSKTIPQLLEDDVSNPTKDAFVKVPIAAPEGAVTSDVETPLQLLERIKTFSDNWIKSGHTKGDNTHNVSATVYIKDHEWESVAEWMWNHRDSYNGLSVLPFDGGTYTQTPFERITKEQYDDLSQYVKDIDLSNVFETENVTDLKGEIACGGGGQCELTF